jgi:hypothetical protein
MPLSTVIKLRKVNPLDVDPAQLKIAVRADERIGIREGGVQISLKFDADDGSLNIDDTYVVEVIRNPILRPELFSGKAAWETVTVLQLSDSDARQMTRVQSLLKPYTDGRAAGTLSFGVDVKGVCAYSPVPKGTLLIDIFVQANDIDGFFAITNDLDLRQSGDQSDAMLDSLSRCLTSSIRGDRNKFAIPTSSHFG